MRIAHFNKYGKTSLPNRNFKHSFIAVISGATSFLVGSVIAAPQTGDVELWRLDCGEMVIDDISYFSDSYKYEGQSATISNGCYLVRNGDRYLLWDAGLPREVLGNTIANQGWTSSISITIADQLSELGLGVDDIDFISISHFHGDHIGQAGEFSSATLLMSEADASWLRQRSPGNARRRLAAWFQGDASMQEFSGDHDVFGDGRVTILALPGHTPGHSGLLVNLDDTGPVLMTGDLFHFRREVGMRTVSKWNSSRAETLASIERVDALVAQLDPVLIVQHDPVDIDRLPAFPESAK
ncbi:MAG: N-acyl homoserine lactonase family protein [Pseudomonadota bacterium]